MKTVTSLAKSRIRFNKSRTVFTLIAILLTTTLLMGLGTSAIGLMSTQKQTVASITNYHASMKDISPDQLQILTNHMDVEAVETSEIFAKVQFEKMNAFLTRGSAVKGSIFRNVGNLTEGRLPEQAHEICGPPVFFKRMGIEPKLGTVVPITFRPNDGAFITREFTICGLVTETDVSKVAVSDDRIAYGASVSEALVKEFIPDSERRYTVQIRVNGEDSLNYDQIRERIKGIAEDIGCKESNLNYNTQYLLAMTDPGGEITGGVALIALVILLFSGLVIYSIYYVCVITDIQEIGKLKALGASKKQIRGLLLREGVFLSLLALPPGLLLGYLIPKLGFPLLIQAMSKYSMFDTVPPETITLFSIPVLIGVVCAVLLMVYVSLLKPMSMASKISPIEAIRYQENTTDKRKVRKGYEWINLPRLGLANLSRNKKRTFVTICTMGLSCVLFLSVAALANSMSLEDFARRTLSKGDFMIDLQFSNNDNTYPENNLDRIQLENPMNEELISRIKALEGVTDVQIRGALLASAQSSADTFEKGRRTELSYFTREDVPALKEELNRGTLDYDQLVAENGVVYCYDSILEESGFSMGETLPMTFRRGEEPIPRDMKLMASGSWGGSTFLMPKETFDALAGSLNTATTLFIFAEKDQYPQVKEALREISAENQRFRMYSMDEEYEIAKLSINMIKYPLYAILILIGIISFMNLINTMVTSVITRKRELAVLQAIGLSNRQLTKMLALEGLVFTAGTLAAALTVGNAFGYLLFLWGKHTHFMDVRYYHYPLWESLILIVVLAAGQLLITAFTGKRVHKESLVDRMRSGE